MVKKRSGFVSNSSSSSFVIKKDDLTSLQIEKIKNHIEEGKNLELDTMYFVDDDDKWNITETSHEIKGSCFMDNFDMSEFFDKIGVVSKIVEWGEY